MLKTILSISGKPGLYKLISQGKNMLIVESINADRSVSPLMVMKKLSLWQISQCTQMMRKFLCMMCWKR